MPGAPARASSRRQAPPLPADKLADRARTEVAVHRMGRLGGHRQARLVHRSLMTGECSTARGRSGTVMRHFLPARAFAAPAPVAALTLGMTVSAASRVLIPASRRTHRFAPSEVAATRPAVLLAPITARADEHLAPAPGTQKQSGIVHRLPRRGGLDDPQSPGNTALGAVRKCGSGRSLGHDRQVSGVRGCVGLLADSDLTATHERRHRRCTRRRRPVTGNISSGGEQRHARRGAKGRSRAGLLRPGRVSSQKLFAEYPRPYAAANSCQEICARSVERPNDCGDTGGEGLGRWRSAKHHYLQRRSGTRRITWTRFTWWSRHPKVLRTQCLMGNRETPRNGSHRVAYTDGSGAGSSWRTGAEYGARRTPAGPT